MNLEELIEDCLKNYPSIFGRRDQVLHHLYFVCGNGYDWKDGRLNRIIFTDDRETSTAMKELKEKPDFKVVFDKMVEQVKSEPVLWYPLSKYSKIMTLPDDIQEDYLKGAIEVIAYLLADSRSSEWITDTKALFDRVKRPEEEWKGCIAQMQHNLQFVDEIKERLEELEKKINDEKVNQETHQTIY